MTARGISERDLSALPTGAGLLYAGIALAALVAGARAHNTLVLAAAFFLFAVAALGVVVGYRTLVGLRLRYAPPERAFAGTPSPMRLIVHNPSARARHGVRVQVDAQRACLTLDAHARREVAVVLPAPDRGVHALPPVRVSTRFPLALLMLVSRPLRFDGEWLVYPAARGVEALPRARARDGGELAELRPWRPGDSPAHIAWRRVARDGALVTKSYEAQDEYADIDWHRAGARNTEARLSQLCRWVLDAERQGTVYRFALPGVALAPARGRAHARRCLDALARFD